ncbi:MAG: UDP-N-acetylmuramate--alanine ligase [Thalassobium sp.]|uniref:DUF2484 family protein n=1 Tax=Octadecabacter sp. SW4 TaxID=2602067 RepID=UPI000C0E3DBF|nr:DUF2484 family protein [Octadecabacter sp. SW4]PHQ84729.1 MAG: UDP-N-acetylmuramate--alanine ligase [Thalassobium sp.]QEE35187.1 DUF2484 family protein [Octadecabacter sp. SW4]
MSTAIIVSSFWVLAATVVAFLPMRWQMVPGLALLIAAPVLIIWIGLIHGWWVSALAFAAFGSMFRNPLIYLFRRARGERPEIPK